jgi:hypothetical protein
MKQNERNFEIEAKNILRVAGALPMRRRTEILNKLALEDSVLFDFVLNRIHAEPKLGRYAKYRLQQEEKEDDDDSNPPYSYTGG